MARQVRIEYPGAFYHVTARGNREEDVFRQDSDRTTFLSLLGETCEKTGWKIHGYVLMPNHYHMVVETPQANLVQGMTWLQNTYTVRFNQRYHRRSTPVFGSRYKAIPMEVTEDGGPWLGSMLDFIHLNPVRSGLIQREQSLRAYAWSSLVFYLIPGGMRQSWHRARLGLSSAGIADISSGRREYLDRLHKLARQGNPESAGVISIKGQSAHSSLRRGWYYGSQQFRDRLKRQADNALEQWHSEEKPGDQSEDFAELILKYGIPRMGLDKQPLTSVRKNDWRKALLAYILTSNTTVSLAWVSGHLEMGSRSGVCRYANQIAKEFPEQPHWKRLSGRILEKAQEEWDARGKAQQPEASLHEDARSA